MRNIKVNTPMPIIPSQKRGMSDSIASIYNIASIEEFQSIMKIN